MLESAEEFVRLRRSRVQAEYHRAAHEPADERVWLDVIERYPDMREWVAHNKTVPLSILEILADDLDRRVRGMVAMKRKLTPELLERLAGDWCDGVRMSVARHRRTPEHVLRRLANDRWSAVAEHARKRLDEIAATSAESDRPSVSS